jgi:hypothetical protein
MIFGAAHRACALSSLILLAGCAANRQEVAERLGQQYVGQNVDVLVGKFGPPASQFRLNSGGIAYNWQLTSETDIAVSGDRYGASGWAKTHHCKINVIASPTGTITQLNTEDASGTGGILGMVGVDVYGSVCARHLGIRRET